MASVTERTVEWLGATDLAAVPADVRETTKLRVLDALGLILAAAATPFGRRARAGVLSLAGTGGCHGLPRGDLLPPEHAALLNGTLAQALQYDDTHNETIIHASSPNVAAALALGESLGASGADVLAAIALGIEATCRFGLAAPGRFHGNGFHPTGIFGTFGAAAVAARLLGLPAPQAVSALGLAGSFASGIIQCWTDGTDSQWLHPGWAAQGGITAAKMARAGVTGPAGVIEGRFGVFASHVQDRSITPDFARVTAGLGTDWESRNMSFKPYPNAHVIHAFLDAFLALRAEHGFGGDDVEEIACPVAGYMVGVMCEPREEKIAPPNDVRARVSLAWCMAEAAYRGKPGPTAYGDDALADPAIADLARRVTYSIDETAPGTERFKGWVVVTTKDGRRLERVQEHNHGSLADPMSADEIRAKFAENAGRLLPEERIRPIVEAVDGLDGLRDVAPLLELCVARG